MKAIINKVLQNQFIKNVSILSIGTLVGQAILVSASPLLTRLYAVEDFGRLTVFTSITTFIAVLATGRYEFAIVLPKIKINTLKIIKLIVYISSLVSILLLISIVLLKEVFNVCDSVGFLCSGAAYWSPPYIFLIAANTAMGYYVLRNKHYKRYSIANALQSITNVLVSILLGIFFLKTGMIIALVLGTFAYFIFIFYSEKNNFRAVFRSGEVKAIANEYKDFPRYTIFSDLFTTASQQFTPILFAALYNSTIVGLFSMANRMLRLPNILITSPIASVFRNDSVEEIKLNGECKILYLNTLKKLFCMSLPVYLFLFVASPFLFSFFFGEKWKMSGHFASIMSIFLMFDFLSTPLSVLYAIRGKQKALMFIQALNVISGMLALIIGQFFYNDAVMSLILYGASSILFSIFILIDTYRLSKDKYIQY